MKKLISILGSIFLVAPLSVSVVSCSSGISKRDLNSLAIKDLGEIKGVEDIPTLETIVKWYVKKTGDNLFTVYDVKFVGTPTKSKATLEALESSARITGSVTFNYNYELEEPILWPSSSRENLKVGQSDKIYVDIENSIDTAKLEATIEDERDKKMITVASIEKLEENNVIDKYKSRYIVNYEVNDYIAKDVEKEKNNIKATMSLKYRGVTKNTEITVNRIYLGDLNTSIKCTWNSSEQATEEQIIVAWNKANPDNKLLLGKDVEVLRQKIQNNFKYGLKAIVNLTTWYKGTINLTHYRCENNN